VTKKTAHLSAQFMARLAGVCYLITIGAGAFDHLFVGGKLIVPGDAAATAHNLIASAPLYRLAFTLDLIPVYLVVTVLFYEIFKPVNRSVALLAAFSSLLGGAVGSVVSVMQLAPLVILQDKSLARAFNSEQLQAWAQVTLNLHQLGFTLSLLFFGFYCFLLGALIVASSFMPRFIGVLMAVGGIAYMTYSFAYFGAPSLAAHLSSAALALGSLGELALTLWLLARGLNASKWNALSTAA
jgi:hypothetical protein